MSRLVIISALVKPVRENVMMVVIWPHSSTRTPLPKESLKNTHSFSLGVPSFKESGWRKKTWDFKNPGSFSCNALKQRLRRGKGRAIGGRGLAYHRGLGLRKTQVCVGLRATWALLQLHPKVTCHLSRGKERQEQFLTTGPDK